jgi:adenylate cyclase
MVADGLKVPSLSVELLRVVSGAGAILIKMDEAGVQSVAFGRRGLEISTDRRGQLWVHFSPHDKSRFVSAKDVLSGAADPGRFKGKIVLVGTSAIGLLDLKTTPVDPTMPGVEVHAQLLESMLSGASLTSPSYATLAELAIATLVGLAIIALAPVLGAWPYSGSAVRWPRCSSGSPYTISCSAIFSSISPSP